MAIIEYGGTVIECLSTDVKPDKPDGWFLKENDTGDSYIRRNGSWQFINLGLSYVKATKSGRITTDANGEATVVFNTSFDNADYVITLSCHDNGINPPIAYKYNRTKSGFDIITRNSRSGQPEGNVEVSWLATKDYNL